MAGDLLMSVSKDEHERAVFRSRRMYQSDLESNIATAEKRGEIRGEKRGEKRGEIRGERRTKLTIAANMFKHNAPIDEIIDDTELTREEVENLHDKLLQQHG